MRSQKLFTIASLALGVLAQPASDPFKKYTLSAEGINASFIEYGARITNLHVKDKSGKWQDVVLGYDDASQYRTDDLTNHTYFGPVVG
jgi:aldose 1-epimerase